jgi:hypothetical protein
VNLTNPKTTIFIPARQAWFDTKTQGETQKWRKAKIKF